MTKAPFPWFGGKSKAAHQIWAAIGSDIGNYAEPFFGSGACWLGRPADFSGWSVVNDLDGNIANFWRSIAKHPEATAAAACHPVNECDLHARHLALVNGTGRLRDRLMADPDYCEPTLAGWWAWGAAVWIGSGWCSGDGPWHAEPDAEGIPSLVKGNGGAGVNRQLPHLGNGGAGVNRQLPHLGNGGKGVNRKLPHLGNGGAGVNRKLPHLGTGGAGVNRQLPHLGDGGKGECEARHDFVRRWFVELADHLRSVRVACGDWERICSPGTLTINGTAGVVLDPPYSQTKAVYANDSSTVAGRVRDWCAANGGNPDLRIVLCGHVGEHHALEDIGWTCVPWEAKKSGGYSGKSDDRERLWLSPHCKAENQTQRGLFE